MEPGNKNPPSGWNDPPTLSYSESVGHRGSPKRNLLNKRVPYPINNITNNTSSLNFNSCAPPLPVTAPPMPMTVFPISSNIATKNDESTGELRGSSKIDDAKSESMLEEVIANIDKVIKDRHELLQAQNKHEHIKKKVDIMKEAWRSKVADDVKEKVLRLSKALVEENKNTANEIQTSLMVDYPKVCSEFISAFRLLINLQ